MKVSILISTYNGENDIGPLLDSILELEKRTYELEVILRDDSSKDDTVAVVEQDYGWVHLIKGIQNLGFVSSNNIAFQQATGSIICCVNQDTILHPVFIEEGLKVLQQDLRVVGVNTNMIMPWVMSLEEFKGKKCRSLPTYEYQLTPFGYVRYVAVKKNVHPANFMSGGGFFVRRSFLLSFDFLFDPGIDMYCEDTELSLRLQRLGGKILYCPGAVVYHNQLPRKASTFDELVKLVRVTRNRFALFARSTPPLTFCLRYPLYLIGIILKMSSLGLPVRKRMGAYVAGTAIAGLFFGLFPCWLIYSLHNKDNLYK